MNKRLYTNKNQNKTNMLFICGLKNDIFVMIKVKNDISNRLKAKK